MLVRVMFAAGALVLVAAILNPADSGHQGPAAAPAAELSPPSQQPVDNATRAELAVLAAFPQAMEDGTADELQGPREILSAYQQSRGDTGATTPPKWAKRLAWKRTRAQGVTLARMGVSEAMRALWPKGRCVMRDGVDGVPSERCGTGGALTPDVRAMAHVIINNRGSRKSFRDWHDVMGFLSPHVAGDKTPTRHRQVINKGLLATGIGPPKEWRDCYTSKARPCDGDWRIYEKTWPVFRQNVIRMWLGWTMPAIDGEPIAWGNALDIATFGRRRGLVMVRCDGCSNGFMQKPVRTVSARAIMRAMRQPSSRRP